MSYKLSKFLTEEKQGAQKMGAAPKVTKPRIWSIRSLTGLGPQKFNPAQRVPISRLLTRLAGRLA